MKRYISLFFLASAFMAFTACNSESTEGTDESEDGEEGQHDEGAHDDEHADCEDNSQTDFTWVPVTWEYSAEKIGEGEYQLTYSASIAKCWYLYSHYSVAGIPTTFWYDDSTSVVSWGEVMESGDDVYEGYDELMGEDMKKFSGAAVFTQTVKIAEPTTLSGEIEFMSCDYEKCMFPDPVSYSFDLEI